MESNRGNERKPEDADKMKTIVYASIKEKVLNNLEAKWKAIEKFIHNVMKSKEERLRQAETDL